MSEGKVCVVTGGRGYLGSQLIAFLQQAGWRAVCACRHPRPGELGYELGGDLQVDQLGKIDSLVHCAYDFEPFSWHAVYEKNVRGTERLLSQTRELGVETFITISSISAFPQCRSLYGRAKLEIEKATLDAGGYVLRPGLIYGGREGGMFGRLALQARTKRTVPLLSGGPSTQYLVHVDDLCRVIHAILVSGIPVPQDPCTIAHPQPWELRDILKALAGDHQLGFISVPWQLAWAGLRLAEFCGIRLSFKSDSILGIVYQNPEPAFADPLQSIRPFQPY